MCRVPPRHSGPPVLVTGLSFPPSLRCPARSPRNVPPEHGLIPYESLPRLPKGVSPVHSSLPVKTISFVVLSPVATALTGTDFHGSDLGQHLQTTDSLPSGLPVFNRSDSHVSRVLLKGRSPNTSVPCVLGRQGRGVGSGLSGSCQVSSVLYGYGSLYRFLVSFIDSFRRQRPTARIPLGGFEKILVQITPCPTRRVSTFRFWGL